MVGQWSVGKGVGDGGRRPNGRLGGLGRDCGWLSGPSGSVDRCSLHMGAAPTTCACVPATSLAIIICCITLSLVWLLHLARSHDTAGS